MYDIALCYVFCFSFHDKYSRYLPTTYLHQSALPISLFRPSRISISLFIFACRVSVGHHCRPPNAIRLHSLILMLSLTLSPSRQPPHHSHRAGRLWCAIMTAVCATSAAGPPGRNEVPGAASCPRRGNVTTTCHGQLCR